jgi:dynein heavy chain
MWSPEREYVPFSSPVYARGPVEGWLGQIEDMMRKTLFDITKASLENYPEDGLLRDEWFFESAAQCVLTIDQVEWTSGCTNAI